MNETEAAKDFLKLFNGDSESLKNLSQSFLQTVLCVAIANFDKNIEVILDFLIESGSDFNEANGFGVPPFHFACRWGSLEAVKKMEKAGADINGKDKTGNTVLHYVYRVKSLDMVKFLLDRTVDIDARNDHNEPPEFDSTPSVTARYEDNKSMKLMETFTFTTDIPNYLDRFIDNGTDLGCNNPFDDFHLPYACHESDIKLVKMLLELKAPVHGTYYDEGNCWELAIGNNNLELLKLLIEHVVKPNINIYGYILHTIHKLDATEIVNYLLDSELNIDINSGPSELNCKTPLMNIASNGSLEQFEIFLKHGANPYLKDAEGKSVLHYAAQSYTTDIVRYIINDLKFDPNSRTLDGKTALHMVNTAEMVSTLIKLGAEIDAQDERNKTALHIASLKNYSKCVDTLLSLGANYEILDADLFRPIDLCDKKETLKVFSKHNIYKCALLSILFSCCS